MALNLCNADVYVVRDLLNTPTQTVDELKAAFDGGAQNLKDWLNATFIPELDSAKQDTIKFTGFNKVLIINNDGEIAESTITATELNQLEGLTSNVQTQINSLNSEKQKKITYGTSAPSGGSNGDIYIQYS